MGLTHRLSEAAAETAQLSEDLQVKHPIILFSWPSNTGILDYQGAVQEAALSVAHLTRLLYILDSDHQQNHPTGEYYGRGIIAHSMGAELLLNALFMVRSDWHNLGIKLKSLVLAAPRVLI